MKTRFLMCLAIGYYILPSTSAINFKVFDLNVAGLPPTSKSHPPITQDRDHRVEVLKDFIINTDYDVYLLQEMWLDGNVHTLHKSLYILPTLMYWIFKNVQAIEIINGVLKVVQV